MAAIALSSVACGSARYEDDADGSGGRRSSGATGASGDELLEFRDLSEWRSYADQVSVINVVSETADESSKGLVTRHLSINVEKSLWSRSAPVEVTTLFDYGWTVVNGHRIIDVPEKGMRLVVGGRYVVALAEFSDGWSPLTPSSILMLKGEIVDAGATPSPGGKSLDGRSLDEVAHLVEVAQPDPLAEKYGDLPVVRRIIKVNAEQASESRSTPPSSSP